MSEAVVFRWLLWACFALAALTALSTLFVTAPYGRHARAGWGPTLDGTLGWVLMEAPAVAVIAACFALSGRAHTAADVALTRGRARRPRGAGPRA